MGRRVGEKDERGRLKGIVEGVQGEKGEEKEGTTRKRR